MRNVLLTVVLLLPTTALVAQEDAQSDLYRVDVVVFTHADGQPVWREVDVLPRFDDAIDPNEEKERRANRPRNLTNPDSVPDQYVATDNLSAGMAGVWQQLEQSPRYRPITWRSWYQLAPEEAATRGVWIHDDEPLEDGDLTFGREHYRLEGTLTHRQEQLHRIALNLTWREKTGDEFRIEGLRQSRGIRLGRLEYFDGPHLAAIVLVTPWQPFESDH